MTLVVGIIAKDGIVMASDSRMSAEINSNDTVKKIIKLNEKNALGVAGDGTLGIHLMEVISENITFEHGIVKMVEQIREEGKRKFDDYYSHLEPQKRPSLTLLIAGYTKTGDARLYVLNSYDNFVPRPSSTGFNCIGVPYFADYLLNRFYQSEITMKQAQALAAFCILETESQAHGVGGNITITSFSTNSNYSELTPSEVAKIKEHCGQLHILNKGKFYPEEPHQDE
jgi:20S proteasome alpha/beta subunit